MIFENPDRIRNNKATAGLFMRLFVTIHRSDKFGIIFSKIHDNDFITKENEVS